tara:strand:- start:152 stop:349 length:198 start_codon:yes stop_codon:yes gene_type:complete
MWAVLVVVVLIIHQLVLQGQLGRVMLVVEMETLMLEEAVAVLVRQVEQPRAMAEVEQHHLLQVLL